MFLQHHLGSVFSNLCVVLHVVEHDNEWFKDLSVGLSIVAHLLHDFFLHVLVDLVHFFCLYLIHQLLKPLKLLFCLRYHRWVTGTLKYLIHEGISVAEDYLELLVEEADFVNHVRLHLSLNALWLPLTLDHSEQIIGGVSYLFINLAERF